MNFGKDYFEAYALIVLATIFNDFDAKFVKTESPDWSSDDIGIEVVRGVNCDEEKIFAFANKHFGKTIEEIGEKKLKKERAFFAFNNGKLKGASVSGLANISYYTEPIKKRFISKLRKLNENYTKYTTNILFIFASDFVDETMVKDFLAFASDTQKTEQTKYDKVYLFTHEHLYCLNLRDALIKTINISCQELIYFKKMAKAFESNVNHFKSTKLILRELENLLNNEEN